MALQTFTTGQVLTAAQVSALQANDYNQTVSTKTANYVLTIADLGSRVFMNAAGATTITVNTGIFAAGDTLWLGNIGAGACVVTAGTATVSKFSTASLTLSQYQGAFLYFVSTGVAILYSDSAGASIPLTTKGDILGFDTAINRVPIGTNNQVLTADSAQALGLKWATPAAPAAAGVFAYAATSQNIANATATTVQLDGENYDTNGFHSNTVNNDRLTVPAGYGGKYLVTASCNMPANTTGFRRIWLNLNSTSSQDYTMIIPTSSVSVSFTFTYTNVITLAAGDYLTMSVYQSGGATLAIGGVDPAGGGAGTWFTISQMGS
jgi:hypothetical protein